MFPKHWLIHSLISLATLAALAESSGPSNVTRVKRSYLGFYDEPFRKFQATDEVNEVPYSDFEKILPKLYHGCLAKNVMQDGKFLPSEVNSREYSQGLG